MMNIVSRLELPQRVIVSFFRDDEGHWVARLQCGHTQHVRHRPPMESREWVTTKRGRDEHIGTVLACPLCTMPALPEGLREARRTRTFTQSDLPEGLRSTHRTRADTWGRIEVEHGYLRYEIMDDEDRVVDGWTLKPGTDGIIAPAQPHRVTPVGTVAFCVVFLRKSAG